MPHFVCLLNKQRLIVKFLCLFSSLKPVWPYPIFIQLDVQIIINNEILSESLVQWCMGVFRSFVGCDGRLKDQVRTLE